MDVVAAEDYYSVFSRLKNDVIQSNSAAFSSIIEKYICLSHGLEPPETDIENFYGGSCARKKHLLKFLEQHKPDRNTPPKHSITSKSPGNHIPSDISNFDDFSRQIQETLRKRKVQLGLPEDSETCEVSESDSDDEYLGPNNNCRQKSCDAKIVDEKGEKRSGRKTAEVNCCNVRSGEKVPERKKMRERGVPSQGQEENVSQEKKEKVKLGNINKKCSQDNNDSNVKQVYNKTDMRILKDNIRIKLIRIDDPHTRIEYDGPKTRIMKRDKCSYIKEVQKDTQNTLQEKEGGVNVLHDRMENLSQNRINKAPQVIKEVCSKGIDKMRKKKIKIGNNEANASTDEKENASQDKNEVLERTCRTSKKLMYKKSILTTLERNNCSQRKLECSYAQPKFSKGDKSFNSKKTQNDSVKVYNSTLETMEVNCENGRDKVCQKKVTRCKDDTNMNKRHLSDQATKSHLNKNGCDDPLKTTKELIDARPGNYSVVLTKYGDTIFLPPLAQHEEDLYTSSMRMLSSKDNHPVFFVTFNAQDTEVSQQIRSPLNDATAEPVTINSCQKESNTVVTPQEKSHSYKGDKSVRKNTVTEELHKNFQDEDDCTSPLGTTNAEPVTLESCERDSWVTVTSHSHQDGKSKSKNKVLEEMYKNSQKDKADFTRLSPKPTIECSQPEETHSKCRNNVKKTVDKRRQVNNTSFSKTVLCSQSKDVSHSQKAKALFNVMSPQHQSPFQEDKTLVSERSPLLQSPSQEEKTLVSKRSLQHQSPSQEEKTLVSERSPQHQSPSQEEKTMVSDRSPQHQSPSQEENTLVNQRSPQPQSPSQEENTLVNKRSQQHQSPLQEGRPSFSVKSPEHKSPSPEGKLSFNVRAPQHKSPSQKGKPLFNVRSPHNKNQSQKGKILLIVRSPQRKSPSQKEKSSFNARSPQHKSPSQNISFLKQQHTGLEKKLRKEDTLDTLSKRVQGEVDNERSDVMQKSPDGGAEKTSGSLTFCKDNLSRPARKPILKRKLSLSKGRIVLEFFDRSALKKKTFGILEDNMLHNENGKEFRGEKVKDDSKRQVGTDASGVSDVKSQTTSDTGEICQERGSTTKNILNKGETKDLSSRKWQNCEESIIAGIDAVKKKRKSLSYGHPMAVDHPKGFVKSVQLGEQNGLVRSISVVPEISSIVEDVTVPLLSSTKSEMLNVLPVPGVQQRQSPIPQNEHSHRRKADAFSSSVIAKKPKLEKPLQLQKNCSLESKSVTQGRLNFVGGTNINNSVPSGKQSDTNASKVRNALSKHLTDSTKKKDVPSYHANNSDSDEELSLLPVEHSSLAAGPHHSSLYTVSKLWSTLRNSQLQNTQMDRFQTKVPATNSTADSNASYTTKMHKNSKSFWELDNDEEMKSYPPPLASYHKHSSTVMQQSLCASQNLTANLSADTSSIPSYSILGGERWLAAVRSVKRHRKPIFLGASFSFTKNKR